jgi:hypothetical protein
MRSGDCPVDVTGRVELAFPVGKLFVSLYIPALRMPVPPKGTSSSSNKAKSVTGVNGFVPM